ncbi:MAG: hypothetical protein JOZ69_08915, partial [Myxococcales bacterium]|nr:hypothetical protein [Myxococcales bacterium]
EAAVAAGETLESLGLAPKEPKESAKPPPRLAPSDLADAVVCAVADATDLLPRALRPLLHAAFARARALGLTLEEVEEGLRPAIETKASKREPPRLRVRVEAQAPDEPEGAPAAERAARSKAR